MDRSQLQKLEKLGINTENTTIEIFEDLLNVAEYLNDLLELNEEERFRQELERIKKNTN